MGTSGMALKAQAKDGTLIPVDISLSPITESSGILVVASMREVTEQQAAEQALLRAKEEAETAREEAETRSLELVNLVHGLPLPTALFDPRGDVMVINQAFTALLGYTIQDIPDVESHWARCFPDVTYGEAIKADWTERVEKSSEEGVPIAPMDLKITAKSGRV